MQNHIANMIQNLGQEASRSECQTNQIIVDEKLASLSILIVEDHGDTAESLVELLSLCGCVPRVSHSGMDAIREALAQSPDIVLLDIGLPGAHGWELAEHLNALSKPPVLIAIAGYGSMEDRRRSEEVGIHLHLVKPVDPSTLLGMLKSIAKIIASSAPPD